MENRTANLSKHDESPALTARPQVPLLHHALKKHYNAPVSAAVCLVDKLANDFCATPSKLLRTKPAINVRDAKNIPRAMIRSPRFNKIDSPRLKIY